jgi:hypothetical protein
MQYESSVESPDRYLAVRFLGSARSRVISHPQRGGTCTFYSTLWLLGIADALISDPGAVDHIISHIQLGKQTVEKAKASESLRIKIQKKNQFLLDRIANVDKAIKKLAFRELLDGKHASVAELVAADYAGCSWLDTKKLRSVLITKSTLAMNEDEALDTTCTVTAVPNIPLLLCDKATTLKSIADWIDGSGYAGTGGKYEEFATQREAAYATFVYMARDLLIRPVASDKLTTVASDADSPSHILSISMYLSFLRSRNNETDAHRRHTIAGMAMRCVRYIVAIVRVERNLALTGHTASAHGVLMPLEYETSLPWVAAEYYAIQEESAAIAHLMFDSANIASLSELDKADIFAKHCDVSILSSDVFHLDWIRLKKDVIATKASEMKTAEREASGLAAGAEKRTLQEKATRCKEKMEFLSNNIKEIQKFELTTTTPISPLHALHFIQCNKDLAVLNVAAALVLHRDGCVRSRECTNFVFGYAGGGSARFCAADHTIYKVEEAGIYAYSDVAAMTYDELKLTRPAQTNAGQPSKSHDMMSQNMEYMFDATRDCSAQKRRTSHGAENKRPYLNVTYPRRSVHLDVGSLVKWADDTNECIASCVYDDRSLEYVLRRHTMPLSANGPVTTVAAMQKLRELLPLLPASFVPGDDKKKTPVPDETKKRIGGMIDRIQRLVTTDHASGTADKLEKLDKLDKLAENADETDLLLVRVYMTIAVHTGHMAAVMQQNFGAVTATETKPDSSWALSPLVAAVDDEEVAFYSNGSKTGRTFVFTANGDYIAKAHNRFIKAGVRFDHWLEPDGKRSAIETHTGVRIVSDGKKLTATIGSTNHEVFVAAGHCAWWDPTYGAAVLPIGTKRVERLIVVPGDRRRSKKCTDYPTSIEPSGAEELSSLEAYLDRLPKSAFVVEFDPVGLLPAASTGTDELVLLFAAYAYAGSRVGTRLMPRVAARSIHDEREIEVPGSKSITAHDAIRLVIRAASCPLGCYSALALLPPESVPDEKSSFESVARDLRCAPETVRQTLVARMISCSVHDESTESVESAESVARRARFSFWDQYGEPELDIAYTKAETAAREYAAQNPDDLKKATELDEMPKLRYHTDEWITTLSATTGLFVRADQRAKVGIITSTDRAWSVVQMGMGFGKSSVIVPILVARYLRMPGIKVVFVTQPPHLVPQAARTVGALIAAHPHVRSMDARTGEPKEYPVFIANGAYARRLLDAVPHPTYPTLYFRKEHLQGMTCKLVVVLSTAEMQCIVRDYCHIYHVSGFIAHIADEVDSESDPMRCEVIIEGETKSAHYNPHVAKKENIGAYYDAACALGIGSDKETKKQRESRKLAIQKLDDMCESGTIQAGTRLMNVFRTVQRNMVHRTHYGMSHIESKVGAVPYPYSGTPSEFMDFSDIDVRMAAFVLSVYGTKDMRPVDVSTLNDYIIGKFGPAATGIIDALAANGNEQRRYYLTELGMPVITMSPSETAVSFVDVMGAAQTFVGFSGTMGTTIEAPTRKRNGTPSDSQVTYYEEPKDPRCNRVEHTAVVHDDAASNELVKAIITGATIKNERVIYVNPAPPGVDRAKEAIRLIHEHTMTHTSSVCIVDGNGELGAFDDDVTELQKTWPRLEYFGPDGRVVPPAPHAERTVRYYSHRNSRGVDSVMPLETVGYTMMSRSEAKGKSRLSEIAQAVFRLRRLSATGPTQTVVLVVLSDQAPGDGNDGAELFAILKANDDAYLVSAAHTKKKQMEHAAKFKASNNDFVRHVEYDAVDPEAATMKTKTAQKQQVHVSEAKNKAQSQKTEEHMFTRQVGIPCYEKLAKETRDDGALRLANRATKTEIHISLETTGIALSPIITIRDLVEASPALIIRMYGQSELAAVMMHRSNATRRAFAVNRAGTLVVLTVVEVWAKYTADSSNAEGPYAYYTHDGAFILGSAPIRDFNDKSPVLLFGRFLCDDALSIEEEIRLLAYIRIKYTSAMQINSFRRVVDCLTSSKFLSRKTVLLVHLALSGESAGSILNKQTAEDLTTKIAGNNPVLHDLFLPIITRALSSGASPSFGRAAKPKTKTKATKNPTYQGSLRHFV